MKHNDLAIVFPGQGSQTVGMLTDLVDQFPIIKTTFAEASAVLGYDLWQLVAHGPAEELNKTTYTQPALLTASYAIWQILNASTPLQPAFLAGHSLGEYTALVCANALQFKDAVKLVAARGQYMQEAVVEGEGAMAAIVGLDEAVVADICQTAAMGDEVLAPANFNSIGQVVIAGHREAVLRAMALATEKKAKLAVLIPVSVPSHCQLMQPAALRLAELIETITFTVPTIPVLSNADVIQYHDGQAIRSGLVKQLSQPVRWVETIQAFEKAGVTTIVECGPGKVLTGLNKRINKNLRLMATTDNASLQAVIQAFSGTASTTS